MKRILVSALVLSVVSLGLPAAAFAAVPAGQQQVQSANGKVAGTAKHSSGTPIANQGIRLRSTTDGAVVATSTTDAAGAFTFANVPKGVYIVELLDDSGQVIATSATVTLSAAPAGMSVTGVLVTLNDSAAAAAAAAGAGASHGFFTSTAGILLMAGAAGAGAVAIVATQKDKDKDKDKDKSPSK